jgi:hypothetical protein
MVRSDLTGDTPRVADLRLHKFRVEIFDRRELQPEIVSPRIDQATLPAAHHGTESAEICISTRRVFGQYKFGRVGPVFR